MKVELDSYYGTFLSELAKTITQKRAPVFDFQQNQNQDEFKKKSKKAKSIENIKAGQKFDLMSFATKKKD